jgi:hypothetical protein
MVLLIEDLRSSYGLWDIIDPPSSLCDDGMEDILEGHDEAASHVVDKLFIDDVVCSTHYPMMYCVSMLFLYERI